MKLLLPLIGGKESGSGSLAFSPTLVSALSGVFSAGFTLWDLNLQFEHALSERLTTFVDENVFWMPQNSEPGALQAVSWMEEWLQEDITIVYSHMLTLSRVLSVGC